MYATTAELRQRLGDAVYDEIYLSPAVAEADLAAAVAEIDGALTARYRLPITGSSAAALLKDWTLTLAEERAYARPAGGDYPEKTRRRVEQVRKYLEQVRAGDFALPDAEENPARSAAFAQSAEPVFGRKKMSGF